MPKRLFGALGAAFLGAAGVAMTSGIAGAVPAVPKGSVSARG
jgi:hypothetical protein